MISELFIVTYRNDYPYLKHCLRSIDKFASGFGLTILIPSVDAAPVISMARAITSVRVQVRGAEEWPEKGMLWHMAQIMRSDQWCPEAHFITHIDADCIFTKPVTPETFIKDGKPILQYERFESIQRRHGGVMMWQKAAQKCLPFEIEYETMRGHGETYHRHTYMVARNLIEHATGRPVDEYIASGPNKYPQEFCEFVALGNVAMKCFPDKYHMVNMAAKDNPDRSDFPIGQFWSHGDINAPQDIWWEGKPVRLIPIEKIAEVLGK